MLSGQILTYKGWEGEVGYEIPATLMGELLKFNDKRRGALKLFQKFHLRWPVPI